MAVASIAKKEVHKMIELKGLCKNYGQQIIYKDFSLTLEEGKQYALLGPSGCGKTTLMRIMAGLESYEQGELDGLKDKKLAYVFQEDRLMPWLSVEENLAYVLLGHTSKPIIEARITHILELLQLGKSRKTLVSQLSGGMKRRVAIGRALIYEADLILLDEPLKGLEKELKEKILKAMIKMWQANQQTVVYITHEEAEANWLDQKIYLEKNDNQVVDNI